MEPRAATADDIDAVLAFWAIAAAPPSVSDDRAGVEALLARDPGSLILVTDSTGIVGTIIAAWDGWRGHMYRLAVRPDARRRGVARHLVAAAEGRFARLGARKVQGIVLVDNDPARAFWEANGYAHDAATVRHAKVTGAQHSDGPSSTASASAAAFPGTATP